MFDPHGILHEPPSDAAASVRYRGFALCHGCSNGRHTAHTPVDCMCDLPGCAKEPS